MPCPLDTTWYVAVAPYENVETALVVKMLLAGSIGAIKKLPNSPIQNRLINGQGNEAGLRNQELAYCSGVLPVLWREDKPDLITYSRFQPLPMAAAADIAKDNTTAGPAAFGGAPARRVPLQGRSSSTMTV